MSRSEFHPPGTTPRPSSDGRSGVILMETILVLPILLMLLGGMFVAGDLMMGRLVAQEMDRSLAWRAKDRFGPSPFERDAFVHVIGPHGITEEPGLFAFEATGSGMGNRWSSVFAGRSDVRLDLPWWVALVNTQDAVMGDPAHPDRMESSFKLNSDDAGFTKAARSYVFRRREDSNGGERSAKASGLAWLGIAGDKMAGRAIGGATGGGHAAYNRNPNAILVSGDPGP